MLVLCSTIIRRYSSLLVLALTSASMVTLTGCSQVTPYEISSSFDKATHRIKSEAVKAFNQPEVLYPLAGAALIAAGDWDRSISDWASESNPIFGSQESAQRFSDDAQDSLERAARSSALLVLNTDYASQIEERLVATRLVSSGSYSVTQYGKEKVGRVRPNLQDTRSFPSGHTSNSFTQYQLIADNLEHSNLTEWQQNQAQAIWFTTASLTGWARVEAQKHYPTDVLVGAALGNFMGNMLTGLMTPEDGEQYMHVSLTKSPSGGSYVTLSIPF